MCLIDNSFFLSFLDLFLKNSVIYVGICVCVCEVRKTDRDSRVSAGHMWSHMLHTYIHCSIQTIFLLSYLKTIVAGHVI